MADARPHSDIVPPHMGVDWKTYVDVRIKALEDKIDSGFANIKQATEDALRAMNKVRTEDREEMNRRLEGMNEIRRQLDTQAGTFLTIETFGATHEPMRQRLDKVEQLEAKAEGKASQSSVLIGWAFSFIAVLLALYAAFGHKP